MSGEPSLTLQNRPDAILSINLRRACAAIAFSLLAAAALTLAVRRSSGALEFPLDFPAILIAALLTALAAIIVRLSCIAAAANFSAMLLTSLAVSLLAISLCLPNTNPLGIFLLCTILGAEESWAWARYIRRNAEPSETDDRQSVRLAPAYENHLQPLSFVAQEQENLLPDDVTQQLTRTRSADGSELIFGRVRASFSPGQRTASVHVAFCPPLGASPRLEVEQLDGPEARIKTAQLLPYGVRLDLKLQTAAAESLCVLVEFSASTP